MFYEFILSNAANIFLIFAAIFHIYNIYYHLFVHGENDEQLRHIRAMEEQLQRMELVRGRRRPRL